MMRKLMTGIMMMLCMLPMMVCAEGPEVTEKSFIEFTGEDTAYFFAKIENNGTEPISLGSGKLVGFSENDDLLITEEYISTLPSYISLAPGEHVYAREFIWDTVLGASDVADYKFSMETRDNGDEVSMIDCEVQKEFNGNYDNYIVVTFTNDSEEILYDFYVTTVLHDDAGNLIFANGDSASTIGLHPGSTISLKMYVDSDFFNYYTEKGINIGEAEAQVFAIKE